MKDIERFRSFLQRHFPVEEWKAAMRDERRRPHIAPATIAQLVMEMVPRTQTSLLQVDLEARWPEVRAWHGSDRDMVASDSTVERSLRGFALEPLHRVLWESARRSRRLGGPGDRRSLPSGRKVRLGIVDGTECGGHTMSVLALGGTQGPAVAGYEMSAGRGHELTTSRRLLRDAVRELGRSFADLILADGLYITDTDLRWAVEEGGAHLVVKTSEETLTVVDDARELFFGNPAEVRDALERAKGLDVGRQVEYEIVAASGFHWGKIPYSLKVAWVKERFLKPKAGHPEETTFWTITTDETLTAEDLRDVAHARWQIENGVFRTLNAWVKSKRHRTTNPHVQEAFMGLWFLGFNLVNFFLSRAATARPTPFYPTAKTTVRSVLNSWRRRGVLAFAGMI